jgi:hypothetical protein
MADQELTFEAIDAHIAAADLASISPGGKHHLSAAMVAQQPAAVLPNVCAAYKIVRPILQGLLLIPFLKTSWKNAIRAFINFMDGLCP